MFNIGCCTLTYTFFTLGSSRGKGVHQNVRLSIQNSNNECTLQPKASGIFIPNILFKLPPWVITFLPAYTRAGWIVGSTTSFRLQTGNTCSALSLPMTDVHCMWPLCSKQFTDSLKNLVISECRDNNYTLGKSVKTTITFWRWAEFHRFTEKPSRLGV